MGIDVSIEATAKKAFASAIDWPGWCRSGKTEALALEALAAYADRYAVVAAEAGFEIPSAALADLDVVARIPGNASTDYGVPGNPTDLDHRALSTEDAARQATLVAAAWAVLDRVVAGAPAELRKGPRGGGRDRDKVVAHVVGADGSYAQAMGLRLPEPGPADRAAVTAQRAALLEVLGRPSDGSPLAGRKWPARYAARRIAWHALDHAWEIEDRTELAPG